MTMINRLGLGQRGFYFGLGLAVGLGFVVHGAAASSVSTPCRPASTSKPPATVSRSAPAQQAQTLVSDGHRWRLSLERTVVTTQVHGALGTDHARGKYVVVFVRAQNIGRVPQTLDNDQNVALVDAQGRRFGLASGEPNVVAAEQYNLDRTYDALQPTFSAHIAFVFDVAPAAHGFTLVNVPLFSDRTQQLFRLGV